MRRQVFEEALRETARASCDLVRNIHRLRHRKTTIQPAFELIHLFIQPVRNVLLRPDPVDGFNSQPGRRQRKQDSDADHTCREQQKECPAAIHPAALKRHHCGVVERPAGRREER
jgi:hypothetical protein